MSIIIGEGSPRDRASIQLATRRGTYIPNCREREHAPESLKDAARIWQNRFPRMQVRSLTSVYNCMGLVFGSRRTSIDTDQLRRILIEDEYVLVASLNDVQPGDVVVYRRGNDSPRVAVVVKNERVFSHREIIVMSQWGKDGEYIHPVEDVPEELYGHPAEYWTDRRQLS